MLGCGLYTSAAYTRVFTVLLPVFKVLYGLGPLYLSELLEPYIPSRNLRSTKKNLLVAPQYNLKT